MAPLSDAHPEPVAPQQPALRLIGVRAAYAKGRDAPNVLAGIDFTAAHGMTTTITGGPAAGKSTLIDVLSLRLVPRDGEVDILGMNARKLSMGARTRLKRRIGLIRQSPILLEHMSLLENVALPLRLAGKRPRDYADDVAELLDFIGLGDLHGAPAATLSGSERRRAAIARAVVMQPALLLADEPTAGLAPELAGKALRLLLGMRGSGAAIVVATQDEALAEALGGDCWRFERARLERTGAGAGPAAAPQARTESAA